MACADSEAGANAIIGRSEKGIFPRRRGLFVVNFRSSYAPFVKAAKEKARTLLGARAWCRDTYSQEGEDVVLARMFDGQKSGFYVDVGAHHPFRHSNTYLLYRRGWHGLNIDAKPGSMAPFLRARPRDKNLELGVSAERGVMEFFVFDVPEYNTFDPDLAHSRDSRGIRIIDRVQVQCFPLSEVLSTHLPPDMGQFEILSVDVEGLDLEVLKTNDWDRFRPKVVVAEDLRQDIYGILSSPMSAFLRSKGYEAHCKLMNSVIYVQGAVDRGLQSNR